MNAPEQFIKPCPKCETPNHTAQLRCRKCGHQLRKPAPRKPKAKAPERPEQPEFAAGLTVDGGLLLMWPREGDFQTLTWEQTDIVRRVIAALGADEAAV